jgi:hypothetical protein
VISPSQGRYRTQTQNKDRHPCLRVGFEPTIPAFERAKTVHALERAATVIGFHRTTRGYIPEDRTLHPKTNSKMYFVHLLHFTRDRKARVGGYGQQEEDYNILIRSPYES